MRRGTVGRVLQTAAALLPVLFVVLVAVDWHTYTTTVNSAPFRYWVLVRVLECLLPSLLLFLVGSFLRRYGK